MASGAWLRRYNGGMMLDPDICYRALETRDARFDGRFFTAVQSTGIFCRPVCPARTPRRENCLFVPSAAAALALGFRPCLRCRPESAPDAAIWRGSANSVARALRLIAEGALDEQGEESLAARMGIGARHLRRLFARHLGASPLQVAHSRRLLFAKSLITDTGLPLTQVALAAGFGSLRRFNDAVLRGYGRPPGALRRAHAGAGGDAPLLLTLPYRPPYAWDAMCAFLRPRLVAGVEWFEGDVYARTIALPGGAGVIRVEHQPGANRLAARLTAPGATGLGPVAARLRRMFDVGADPAAIAAGLRGHKPLEQLAAATPGLRIPGAWSPFEMLARAMLGQQVSVAAATTLAGRLAAKFGPSVDGGRHLFPEAADLAGRDLAGIGLPGARARALADAAAKIAEDPALLAPEPDLDRLAAKLAALPGVGPWTAQYVALRGYGEPDAWPAGDLGLNKALAGQAADLPESWRPWRGYAALYLWKGLQ